MRLYSQALEYCEQSIHMTEIIGSIEVERYNQSDDDPPCPPSLYDLC